MEAMVKVPVPSSRGIERPSRRDPRRETDAGVTLGGGRRGEGATDGLNWDSVSEGSTLPPPYSSHFEETRRCVCFYERCR